LYFQGGNKIKEMNGWWAVALGVVSLFAGWTAIDYGLGIETIWVIILRTFFTIGGVFFITCAIWILVSRNK